MTIAGDLTLPVVHSAIYYGIFEIPEPVVTNDRRRYKFHPALIASVVAEIAFLL